MPDAYSTAKKLNSGSTWLVVAALVIVGFITLGGKTLGSVTFKSFDFNAFSLSITPLLAIALLVERTIEVFFGMARAPGDREIEAAQPDSVRAAIALGVAPEAASSDLAQRKADNTKVAFVTNAILSLTVSLAGVRILALLIEPCQTAWGSCSTGGNLSAAPGWWQLIDVVLTAGLLGGGANGIHSFTQVLGSYLDRAKNAPTERLRAAAPATSTVTLVPPGKLEVTRVYDS